MNRLHFIRNRYRTSEAQIRTNPSMTIKTGFNETPEINPKKLSNPILQPITMYQFQFFYYIRQKIEIMNNGDQ